MKLYKYVRNLVLALTVAILGLLIGNISNNVGLHYLTKRVMRLESVVFDNARCPISKELHEKY